MLGVNDEHSGLVHFCSKDCDLKPDAQTVHAVKWFVEPTRFQIGVTEAEVDVSSDDEHPSGSKAAAGLPMFNKKEQSTRDDPRMCKVDDL